MKKRMILTAITVFLLYSIPQHTTANQLNDFPGVYQEVQYKEINADDLPSAISDAIAEGYTDYTIDKTYKGSDATYKIVVSKSEEKLILFYNEKGELLKSKSPEK
jgi:hypothetical protein